MRRAHRLLAGLLTAGALLTVTTGCAQSVDPIARLGRKAAQRVDRRPSTPAAVHGDHGAPGALVVVACVRAVPAAGHAGTAAPARHWWPGGGGAYAGVGAGTECARR
ncbi:hypothetical protein E6P78_12200 [Streptomyces sp. A0958]|uniref:hypothetical protein n=1 Tax=Streptomyces sp. A0958 TaxID=2563101 RepID=UPI00109E768D|nr:hypothetical protein [Streptomyces sp. A0958]THA69191.1 hypothetical protein E6P78_12200 [Streptomyces sp. A0958]